MQSWLAPLWNLVRRPTAIYMMASALTRVGGLLLVPFYTRAMPAADYGDYALALTILALGPALALGFPAALTKFYFDVSDKQAAAARYGAVARILLGVSSLVAVLAQVLITALAPSGPGLLSLWGLTCVNIATWGSTLLVIPVQFARDTQRPLLATAFQGLEFVLTLSLGILFAYGLSGGLFGALAALGLTYGLLGLTSVAYTWWRLPARLHTELSREAFSFSLPYVPHFLAVWVQGVVERWALKFAGESEALASYSIANQLSSPVNLAVLSWNLESSARSGEVFRSEGTEGLRRNLKRVTKQYLLVSALPSALILALLPLVRPVFGDRYGDVIWYAPFLLAAIAIEACYNPPNQVAYYTGHSGRIAAATTFSAVAAMVASAVLVPQFGAWGAAAARIIAALSRTGAMWYTAYDCLRRSTGSLGAAKV